MTELINNEIFERTPSPEVAVDFDSIPREDLEPGEYFCIDTKNPLVRTPKFNVVAEINTGDGEHSFLVLDIRKSPSMNDDKRYPFGRDEKHRHHNFDKDVDFVIVGQHFRTGGKTEAYKGIRKGEKNKFTMGGNHYRDRFKFRDDHISGDHFKINYDNTGRLYVKDVGSRKGTSVKAHEDKNGTWDKLIPAQREKRKKQKKRRTERIIKETKLAAEAIREQEWQEELRARQEREAARQRAEREAQEREAARQRAEREAQEREAARQRARGSNTTGNGHTAEESDSQREERMARERAEALRNPEAARRKALEAIAAQERENRARVEREISQAQIEGRMISRVRSIMLEASNKLTPTDISDVLTQIDTMRSDGQEDKRIYRQLQQKYHPDFNENGHDISAWLSGLFNNGKLNI